jgi:hypothetical protein
MRKGCCEVNESTEKRLMDELVERLTYRIETKVRAQVLDTVELALDQHRFQLVKRNIDSALRGLVQHVRTEAKAVLDGAAEILARPVHFAGRVLSGGGETPDGWRATCTIICECGKNFRGEVVGVDSHEKARELAQRGFDKHVEQSA